MSTPRPHDDSLRLDLIRATANLLAQSGPGAVSLREIARECETSTTAIYSLFGGKAQIIKAVAAEGFADLAVTLSNVPRGNNSTESLVNLARVYRNWAKENPSIFAAMFAPPQPTLAPGTPAHAQKDGEMEELIETSIESAFHPIREVAGQVSGSSRGTEQIVQAVWSLTHGWVTLELRDLVSASDFERYASDGIAGLLK